MLKTIYFLIGIFIPITHLFAQETFPKNDIDDQRDVFYAFTNATIYQNSRTKIKNATLLIKSGKIIKVGSDVDISPGTIVFDLSGRIIYPSFIDIHTHYGLPDAPPPVNLNFMAPEKLSSGNNGPFNANEAIKSNYHAVENFEIKSEDAKTMRDLGFGTVLTFMPDGIARGTSALVTLSDIKANEVILVDKAAALFSFSKGSSSQMYPMSLMGSNALLRQTHYDAQWYANQKETQFYDESLEAYLRSSDLPQIFSTSSLLNLLRADNLGDEIGEQFIIKGNGDEYQKIKEVKAMNAPLIVPVNFPAAPDVSDPLEALDVSLETMKHWELAPINLGVLEQGDLAFAISTTDLKEKSTFWPNIKKAIKNGLSEEAAFKALTETPAKLIRADDKVGQLKPGLVANFIICTNNIFSDSSTIHENWIQGKRFIISAIDSADYSGQYNLSIADTTYQLDVTGKPGSLEFKIVQNDSVSIKVTKKIENKFIILSFKPKPSEGNIRLSGWIEGKQFKGNGQLADGSWVNWSAKYTGSVKKDESKENKESSDGVKQDEELGDVIYPFIAYGGEKLPEQETILIKNTTVWSNEADGILYNTDVLIEDGKIKKIGKDLENSSARVIDGTGKHLTPGIIDEHSHIALSSINDWATNSSMVRMKDVLDPDQINIYRQLAGGVTTSQLLHGSANPIGGQSAIIKLRWGRSAEELLIKGADKYIKFALGENVTRASNPVSIRYPQSRMGVEQVYMDCFTRAKEYGEKWDSYNNLLVGEKSKTIPPRRELDLEALLEIIRGERFITCHSYVQSEINMLIKVAEQFGFKVNTFTHILEGYKVADKMKAHGAGASSFSDWYNYKMEVVDAIPYNAAILLSQGIITAINSDDAEMARRLNQEAAKSVKYGGVSEEEALKLVTLYPAKLLHLDDRMGSIKVGKDADVVLWTNHPLSIYSRPEKTIIDGIIYFDIEEDVKLQQWIEKERARLMNKIKQAAENGEKTESVTPAYLHSFHCDDLFMDNQ